MCSSGQHGQVRAEGQRDKGQELVWLALEVKVSAPGTQEMDEFEEVL